MLRITQIHFFALLPELPKWPKQKNSCYKMWLIEQLYIELGSILLINPVTKFTFCSASARCWLDKLLRALLPTFSTLCETDLANFLMFFFSFWPRLMREPPMLPTALLTERELVNEWVANSRLFPANLAYMAHQSSYFCKIFTFRQE